ncbi:MAG: S41 family peptidase [Pyrinomonadaceae bacterium]
MSYRNKFALVLASATIASYALLGSCSGVGNILNIHAQQPINDAGAQVRIFESVLQHIQNYYVDEPNLEKVRTGALRGLANGLDPYSSYLTADQVKDYQDKKQNTLVGVGAEFSQVSYLYVISVIKDSPADKAGLKSGDFIEYIDNKATRDMSLYDARRMMLGEAGSKINLRVLRPGEKPQTLTINRGAYKIPQAEARIENGKIGVIKVYSLEDGESNDIKNHVQNLAKQGVQKIVLDLRGVAAGNIQEGVNVANLFIKDGKLAEVIGRDNKVLETYNAEPSKFVFEGKVATLIDLATSGAAEVVSSAMIDRQRGDVIGEKSFGAGTVQQLFTLRGGDGLLLTTAKWASANGKTFLMDDRSESGVKPSIEVKRPETPEPIDPEDLTNSEEQNTQPNAQPSPTPTPVPVKQEDLQLKKALEILMQDKPMSMQKAA